MRDMIKFDMPKNQSSIIKVIGVGGGGSNAVNHMYELGIKGVDFIVCNTDAQAMDTSGIPTKIQLGEQGLGAGSIPSVGKESATEKEDLIREILEKNTKMLFITAGMGGGTGTGAAPVIASIAKELDILTVGIVTIPFSFEGRKRKMQAEEGIKELKKNVDTLLVICNDKLRELYGDLKLSEAFKQADNVLTTAAKGIAEIITVTGYINVDFEDVRTVMQDSGKAIMGSAEAEGDNRAIKAVKAALSSPLLNDNDIEGAGNVLLYIASGAEEISMDEVSEITDYIQEEARSQAEIIWGNGIDESLGNKISITLIATGFDSAQKKREEEEKNKVTHLLGGKQEEINTDQDEAISAIDKESIRLIRNKQPERVLAEETFTAKENINHEPLSLFTNPLDEPKIEIPLTEPVEEVTEARFSSPGDDSPGISGPGEEAEDREFVFRINAEDDGIQLESESPVDAAPEFQTEEPDSLPADVSEENGLAEEKDPTGEKELTEEKELTGEKELTEEKDPTGEKTPFEVYIKTTEALTPKINNENGKYDGLEQRTKERIEKLKNLSLNLRSQTTLSELEDQQAYMRRSVVLEHTIPSEETAVSKHALYEGDDNNVEIRSNNAFLHDNVD